MQGRYREAVPAFGRLLRKHAELSADQHYEALSLYGIWYIKHHQTTEQLQQLYNVD
jgi:hypothetical protein